jgi:hypothetical protein
MQLQRAPSTAVMRFHPSGQAKWFHETANTVQSKNENLAEHYYKAH